MMPVNRRASNLARGAAAILVTLAAHAGAQDGKPELVTPDGVRWISPPHLPGVQGAWFLGREDRTGPYHFRVRLAAGARIPPHTHPDARSSTVLKGTLFVGFGRVFDEAGLTAIPAGSIYVAPANVPHFLWARDGAVEYQESGVGPTATVPIPR